MVKSTYKNRSAKRISYGIAAVEKYDGVTVVLESIPDISSDKNAVKKLVGLCNGNQLSLIHLTDVVNDFLTDV